MKTRHRLLVGLLITLLALGLWRVATYLHPWILVRQLAATDANSVDEAARKLMSLGRSAQQALISHLSDQRPSKDVFVATMGPTTVGDACYWILRMQVFAPALEEGYIYKGRKDASGEVVVNPVTVGLFNKSTVEEWLGDRKHMAFRDIQLEAVAWVIAKEKLAGFSSLDEERSQLWRLQSILEEDDN